LANNNNLSEIVELRSNLVESKIKKDDSAMMDLNDLAHSPPKENSPVI